MRTLNIRLLVILIVSGALLVTGVYFLREWQVHRNAGFFLEEAQQAQQQAEEIDDEEERADKLKDAAQSLAWYVRYEPDDVDARAELGLLQFELGDFQGAHRTLEDVVRRDPDQREARRKLVELAMAFRRFGDAREHLEDHLLKQEPDDPQLWDQLGRCQLVSDQPNEAVKSFRKAIQLDPATLQAYRFLAFTLQRELEQPENADGVIKEMVTNNPESLEAWVLAGNYYRETRNFEEAAKCAAKALELDEDARDALWLAAQSALGQGELDKAREFGTKGVETHPEHVPMYTTMADIELRAGKREEAMQWLERGMAATERHAQLVWFVASLLLDGGQLEEAEKLIAELKEQDYSPPRTGYLEARIDYARENWRQAAEQFTSVRGNLQPWQNLLKQADYWRGVCYENLGQLERAEAAYRSALGIDRFFTPPRAALARVLAATGQTDEAQRMLVTLANLGAATPGVLAQLAQLRVSAVLQQPPGQRNWASVEQLVSQIEQQQPDSIPALRLRVQMLLAQDKREEARQRVQEAREAQPDEPALWILAVTMAMQAENHDEAESLLAEAEERFGDTPQLRVLRARYLAVRYPDEVAERLPKLLEDTEEFTPEQVDALRAGLMNIARQTGANELYQRWAERLAERNPENLQLQFALFEQALRQRDRKAAEQRLAAIRRIEGEGPHWLYCRAVLLTVPADWDQGQQTTNDETKIRQALKLLEQAREMRPRWSRLPLLIAGLQEQLGNEKEALENYRAAVDLGERNPGAFRRLISLLNKRQMFAEAQRRLRQMEREQIQGSEALERLKTQTLIGTGDFELALQQARKTAENSEQPQDHIWLARLLATTATRDNENRDPEQTASLLQEAEDALQRAIELSPEAAEPRLALVQFYLSTDRRGDAVGVVSRIKENVTDETKHMALGRAYEMIGEDDLALEQYQQAAEQNPEMPLPVRALAEFHWRNDRPEKAEQLARRLLEDQSLETDQSDQVWARRLIARIMVARGGYPNLVAARELIQKNIEVANAEADRRLKATLDQTDPSRVGRSEAQRALEELVADEATRTAQDMFNLIRIYLRDDQWSQARSLYRELISDYPEEPRYLASYVEALIDHDETADAATYLNQLAEMMPTHFVTHALRAKLQFETDAHREALQTLRKFVDLPQAVPNEPPARLQAVAGVMANYADRLREMGQDELAVEFDTEAEAFYRRFAAAVPRGDVQLAMFLARRGKTAEAIETLEQQWEEIPTGTAAQLARTLLKSPEITPSQTDRVEAIVQAALEEKPDAAPWLVAMADVRTTQSRFDEAERYYRQILENDPDNVIAMNNLAVLLALRGVRLDEAAKLIEQAVEQAGPVATMLDSRATVRMAQGRHQDAIDDLLVATTEQATPVHLFHLARAHHLAGNRQEAKDALTKALDKGLTEGDLETLERPILERMRKEFEL